MTKEKKKNIIIAIAIPLLCFFAAQTGYYRTKCGNMEDTLYFMRYRYDIYSFLQTSQMQKDKTVKYNYLDDKEIDIDKSNIFLNCNPETNINLFKGVSAKMAARIAEAVWFTEFNDTIIEKRPIQVYKEKNCWLVFSVRNMGYRGRPCMEIDCKDGRIISYRFEK